MRSPTQILAESRTIAVVGASRDPGKVAHSVPRQILRHGWRVIPVNPYATEIWGQPCYPTLADIPEPVDLVNVFRPSADTPEVAKQAVAIGAKALWLQQGIGRLGRPGAVRAGPPNGVLTGASSGRRSRDYPGHPSCQRAGARGRAHAHRDHTATLVAPIRPLLSADGTPAAAPAR